MIRRINDPDLKSRLCNEVLRSLPQWFGIEKAILEYVDKVKAMEVWAFESGQCLVGFVAIEKHGPECAEVYVMGIKPQYHRKGIGQKLIKEIEKNLVDQGFRFLQVKTLSEDHPCPHYAQTRGFYVEQGFIPFEKISNLWGEENPCQIYVKSLQDKRSKIHHVEIYVSELEKSEEFWSWFLCDKLGYEQYQKWETGVSFRFGENYLVFVQAEKRFLDISYHRCRVGLNHLAFLAHSRKEVDNMVLELKKRGIDLLYQEDFPHAGGSSYAVYFEDPDRIKIEFVAH